MIDDGEGKVLVARRRAHSHMGGLWEFPGGGVEAGETAEAALVRELAEELAVEATVGPPITFAWHHDEQRSILLLFYRAQITAGVPRGRQGQEVGWVTVAELGRLETPPADAELIRLLQSRQ